MTGIIFHQFTKHSTETYTKTINFTDRLPTGAAVSSAAVHEAIDLQDGSDVSSSLIAGLSVSSPNVSIPFKAAGTDGHVYLVTIKTTLDNSNVLTDVLRVKIVDRPTST